MRSDLPPIQLLFCRTERALSKLIMWGFDEPASHLAVDVPEAAAVIHSDLLGLHRQDRGDFLRAHTVVQSFALELDPGARAVVAADLVGWSETRAGGYDFPAFAYLAGRVALKKAFDVPVPAANPWDESGTYLCTEVAALVNDAVFAATGRALFDRARDLGAMTPWELRSLIMEAWGGTNEADLRRGIS